MLDDFDPISKTFLNAWKYDMPSKSFIATQQVYIPDIIWNLCAYHTHLIHATLASFYTIICHEHIAHICDNKQTTYEFLSTYQPKTSLLKYFLNTPNIQEQFSETIVLKPIYGN